MGDEIAAALGRAGVDDELARDVIERPQHGDLLGLSRRRHDAGRPPPLPMRGRDRDASTPRPRRLKRRTMSPPSRRGRGARGRAHQPFATVQGLAKKKFRWRRPRHTLKGRQTESDMERVGLRLQLRKQQAEAGDIVLLLRRRERGADPSLSRPRLGEVGGGPARAILFASVGGRKRPDRRFAGRWAVDGGDCPGARSGENHHLQGAAAERAPLGRVFAASRRRSLSIAQAA